MPSVNESQAGGDFLNPGLTQGLQAISSNQIVCFNRYVRYVLPLDGYVFWLKADSIQVQGSLHVGADKRQNEDETLAITRCIFTTKEPVQKFSRIAPGEMWVGEQEVFPQFGETIRFAFSHSGLRYRAADIFHYVGDAVYPAMQSQLIDVGQQLPTDTLIVSNSLPAWLSLVAYNPIWVSAGIPNPFVTLYPSFAVPDNLTPPYGSVHIDPSQTKGLQAFPQIDPLTSSQNQLSTDQVRITLYGLTNTEVMNFLNLTIQYSRDTDAYGFMQEPVVVHDEKRTQAELGILAMKKTLSYTVSYNQGAIRAQALQLIEKATATIIPYSFGAA